MAMSSAYDAGATHFESHRALPNGAMQAIRATILRAAGILAPRILDLGAGSGRIGWPFAAANDDYVGVDLSLGMLNEFARRAYLTAAEWTAERTPRQFLERQPTGARFSALPEPMKEQALRQLSACATDTFGSLDVKFSEQHSFELQVFKFQ